MTMKMRWALGIAACAALLVSCGRKTAEWHPEKDGIGLWFDASTSKIARLQKSPIPESRAYEFLRMGIRPEDNKLSFIDFVNKEEGLFVFEDDERLNIKITGPSMVFAGISVNDDESETEFKESYVAVDRSFISNKIAALRKELSKLRKAKNPSVNDEFRAGTIEMIIGMLKEIELPK
jgi:hypothetical protein